MKKQAILGILLIVLIFVGAYFLLNRDDQESKALLQALNKCMQIPVSDDAGAGFSCIINVSVFSKNVTFCEKIKEYANNSYTKGNYEVCVWDTKNAYYIANNFPQQEIWGLNCNDGVGSNGDLYQYPGARAFAYGGNPPCDHVNYEAFYGNNSGICSYLNNEKARSMCVGSAATSLTDTNICQNFSQYGEDFCLVNIVYKDYQLSNISSKDLALGICENIENSTIRAVCTSMIYKLFNNSSVCNFNGDNQDICLRDYTNVSIPHWTYNDFSYYYPA